MRLKDAWSQLAERYTRALDEDDIIDLRSIDFVQDRGVVRSHSAETRFGFMSAPDEASSEGGGAQTEGEDEFDEIDAFAPGAEIEEGLGEKLRRAMPPPGKDPADEDDLKEFLEAEKRRQEKYGSLDEGYDANGGPGRRGKDIGEDEGESSGEEEEEVEVEVLEISSGSDDEDSEREAVDVRTPAGKKGEASVGTKAAGRLPTTTSHYALSFADDESEDELGGWEPDDYSAIYEVAKTPAPEPEVIEIFDSPPPSPPPPADVLSTSWLPDLFPPRLKTPPHRTSSSHVTPPQLQTPPQSFSSTQSTIAAAEPTASPSKPRPKPRPAYKGTPNMTEAAASTSTSPAPSASSSSVAKGVSDLFSQASSRKFPAVRNSTSNVPKSRMVPEVVIVRKKKSKPTVATKHQAGASQSGGVMGKKVIPPSSSPPRLPAVMPDRKGKGKGRTEFTEAVKFHDKESPSPKLNGQKWNSSKKPTSFKKPVSSNKAMGSKSASSKKPASSRAATVSVSPSPPPKPLSTRKRKRVSSLPSSPQNDQPVASSSKLPVHSTQRRSDHVPNSPGPSSATGSRRASGISPLDVPADDMERRGRSQSRGPRSYSRGRSLPGSEGLDGAYGHYPSPFSPAYHDPAARGSSTAPFASIDGAQAQYLLAQAMHNLTYLISAGIGTPTSDKQPWPSTGPPAPYSTPYPPYWPPYTPGRERPSSPEDLRASIGPRSALKTPAHRPYAHPHTPSSSFATLPPSSPEPEDFSSPVPSRARSKSRGRRVSFKLDEAPLGRDGDRRERMESSDWERDRESSPSLAAARGRGAGGNGGSRGRGAASAARGQTPGPS
ncbi:hypothetical protein BV25DRAFT_1826431 [Artomyces pyxidatus]|uniref:Uncharacterized protein n=1 Tax=Artomyces pyxidatus TaxID=48021 RepID=A0ACB8SZU5_9AGAM|nr:hypothetical protein BV25DRAFT_1826431 [Artomyces pyxidatus]